MTEKETEDIQEDIEIPLQDDIEIPLLPEEETLITDDPLGTGFKWYTFKEDSSKKGNEWTISGHDMQVLSMNVPPGESIMTEVGSFMYMHPDMESQVELTCFSGGCCGRVLGGESCVKVILENNSSVEGYVGLTPNFPAKILPLTFGSNVKSGSITAKPGSYMSQLGDVDIGYTLDCKPSTCCCAGLGPCRQNINSQNGTVFLAAGGTLLEKHLGPMEKITVDTRSVVAYEDSVQLGIMKSGSIGICCFSGEGFFNTTLTGPGKVWIQSMNFQKFREAVQSTIIVRDESGDGDNEDSG